MELYKVLLADDEKEIRDGIIRKIDWEANGFTLVGAAENGREAMELAEKLRPDLVMTDIKMPFMDGLELGEWLYQAMPGTKLVIFSGFDDFEYAQRAIKINALEYILKPINALEITALLQKIKLQLDEEISEKRNLERLREHYNESLPILRQQLLARIIEGKTPAGRAQSLASQYGLDIGSKYWAVCIIHADSSSEIIREKFKTQLELIPLSLSKITEEVIADFTNFLSFIYNEDVLVLAKLKSPDEILPLVDEINRVCKTAKRFLDIPVSAGIGAATDKIRGIRQSYEGALAALDYHVLLGERAIYINDIEPDFSSQPTFGEAEAKELLSAVKLSEDGEIRRCVNKIILSFRELMLPLNQYQIYLTEMIAELVKIVRSYNLDADEIFGREFKGYFHMSDYDSLEELENDICSICSRISSMIKRERMDSAKLLAEKTREYIATHYMESDMSVETLCSHLHVSPAYFSTIFKRETGTSFITHLTEVRMEAALRLLNTTDDKTYIISSKVGYTEPNYFSYVFKKHFGVSPSKYRTNNKQNEEQE